MAAASPCRHVTIVHGLVSVQLSWARGSRGRPHVYVFIRWTPAEPKPETTLRFQVQVHPGLTCWNPAGSHLKWNTQTHLPSYCLHTLLSIVYNIHCIDTKLKKKKKKNSDLNQTMALGWIAWTPFSGRIAYRRFKRTESVQIQ